MVYHFKKEEAENVSWFPIDKVKTTSIIVICYCHISADGCPSGFTLVGDSCMYETSGTVDTSEGCLTECESNIPVEIHTADQLAAVKAYVVGSETVNTRHFLGW